MVNHDLCASGRKPLFAWKFKQKFNCEYNFITSEYNFCI